MTWYGKAKEIAREYIHNTKELAAIREGEPGGGGGGPRGKGKPSRPTEEAAMRALASERAAYLERATRAVEYAMERVLEKPNGYETIKLYRMVYEKKTHSLTGAALELHVAYETAKRWNRYFLRMIAERMGYIARR